MHKITVVGAGRVGENVARISAERELAREVALIDVRPGAAEGAALDIAESAPLLDFDTRLSGSTDPALLAGSDLIVLTAGVPRQPGMSRSDVLETNRKVMDGIARDIATHAPDALVLMVSNPVDVLAYHMRRCLNADRRRVFGQAGALDTARMATFMAMETGLSARDASALVIGGHGDTMVPLARYSTVRGVPLPDLLGSEAIRRIEERTRNGGAEILNLRGNSSAYNAPAAAVCAMIEAIARDEQRLIPTVCIVDGEYGEREVAIGVPAVLGRNGIERIMELDLTADEKAQFAASARVIREDIAKLGA